MNNNKEIKIACKAGCAFCCYIPVYTKKKEALEVFEACDKNKVKHNLNTVSDGRDFSPCPLLDRKKRICTVYEKRPTACKQFTSTSRNACKKAHAKKDSNALIPVEMSNYNYWVSEREKIEGTETKLLVDWLKEFVNGS